MNVKIFIFNPFYENTYILFDETKECVIIDPGCLETMEEKQLVSYIESNGLKPVHLLNTHCHIDHVFGNRFVSEKWNLPLQSNKDEQANLRHADVYADQFGLPAPHSPDIEKFLLEGDMVKFGNTELKVLFVPGHSAGHIAFYNEEGNAIVGGDVLFRESIGRSDLPGGNHNTLLNTIRTKFFTLPDETVVYPGHGPGTTIAYEKEHNPFLND